MPIDQTNLEAHLAAAVDIDDADRREEYLRQVCGGDAALLAELQAMVRDYMAAGSLIDRPAAVLPTLGFQASAVGTTIGPYKLRELLAEGGMGSVYVAEQEKPVRRKVALKIIKPGMDSREVIARFEAERQALALMDHPNIARVLDAGMTEAGRPYFVMELVKGLPITEHCDAHKLATRQRLDLFLQVCHAVQHAHQKGIIHRDLKPSNVMVAMHDATPVVKVIDFGVAKAIGPQLTEHTLYTGFAQLIGTPLYMSPEQAGQSSLDIDTRSDVYSLGVLLYELLTGGTPFDRDTLRKAGFDGMRQIIREVEPPRPSVRVTTIEAGCTETCPRCHGQPRELARLLQGELDWIVMKCLEKDRNRRYESASALAADVQRFLADEPVEACPPSVAYRLRKFVRRHRSRLLAAALLTTLALAALGTAAAYALHNSARIRQTQQDVGQALAGARTATETGDLAMAARLAAAALGRFGADREALPSLAAEAEQTQQEIADRQADAARFQQFLKLAADAQDKMSYDRNLGGDRLAEQALALYGIEGDGNWLSRLDKAHLTAEQRAQVRETAYITLVSLADFHVRWTGDPKLAERSLQLLDRAGAFHEPTRAFYFVRRECRLRTSNQAAADEDAKLMQKAPARTAWDHYLPGHTAGWRGNRKEAIDAYKAALRVQPNHFNSLFFLALYLGNERNSAAAAQIYRACQALRPDHEPTLRNRASALLDLREYDDAEACLSKALQLRPNSALGHVALGRLLSAQGKTDEGLASCRKALECDPNCAAAHHDMGVFFDRRGNVDEAVACWRRAVECDPNCAPAHLDLGNVFQRRGKFDEAIACWRRAVAADPNCAPAQNNLGASLTMQAKYDEAIVHLRKAVESDSDNGNTSMAYNNLGNALKALGKHDEAVAAYRKAIEREAKQLLGLPGKPPAAKSEKGKP